MYYKFSEDLNTVTPDRTGTGPLGNMDGVSVAVRTAGALTTIRPPCLHKSSDKANLLKLI